MLYWFLSPTTICVYLMFPAYLPKLARFGLFLVLVASESSISHAYIVPWTTTPFNMQSIPLHVKNPCNSMWAPQAFDAAQVSSAWPRLWDTSLEVRIFIFCIDPV